MDVNSAPARDEGASAYLERVLTDMSDCAFVLGPKGVIVFANDAARTTLGLADYVGKSYSFFSAESPENDAFNDMVLAAIHNKETRNQGRCPYVAPDGTHYVFSLTSSYLYGADGGNYLVVTCDDVTAEERAEQLRRESITVFLSSIVYLCLYVFAYAVWDYAGQPFQPSYMTRLLEVGGVILGVVVFRGTSLTLADLGLGTENLAHNLKVAGIACAGIIAFMAVLKLIMMNVAPDHIMHPEAFCDPSWVAPSRFIFYIFTALTQEFLSRGIMQESLLHVIVGKHREVTSILMSTIMFMALHLHYGPLFMLAAGLMLGIFGIIYMRQRSIWGLSLIHFTFGMSAAILGLI